jgi:hypothetical protein
MMLALMLLGALVAAPGCSDSARVCTVEASLYPPVNKPMFHGDRARLGWNADEPVLTPARVSSPAFGKLWDSPPLDAAEIDGRVIPPHLYASPLYVESVAISGGPADGAHLPALFAATTNGWAYAVAAFSATCGRARIEAGTVLWRTQLGPPAVVPNLDGGMPLGVLSTPAIDLEAPGGPRLYVASNVRGAGWQVFALELGSGRVVSGWPVTLDDAATRPLNVNGPATFAGWNILSQRGALNLSPSGHVLYVPFGAYFDGGAGWMIAVDTRTPSVRSAFSSAPSSAPEGNGGIWGAGGSVVDESGRLYATTGNSPSDDVNTPGVWGESLLAWDEPLVLAASYTPWNYCQLELIDADIGGSSPVLLPVLSPSETRTPHLIVFGGKQGNVYLVDRDRLPDGAVVRPGCSNDPQSDRSLLAPSPQPQFGVRGPLNVFGPYTEAFGNLDYAKMRSTPVYFRDGAGRHLLFVSGSSKAAADSQVSVAPSLARLQVVTAPGAPAYLVVDALDGGIVFLNPGSPVVSSHGPDGAIVWVLDENASRLASLVDPAAPHPVLWAVDAATLQPLWRSSADDLQVGGKYSTPLVAHGVVFVGTDRIQAFGLAGL